MATTTETKQKCAHKGCGKVYTDPQEDCVYHPGPPEFHEGQKGWKCCKPRVLTFDEFLEIPPCTTGKHSTVDENAPSSSKATSSTTDANEPKIKPIATSKTNATTSAANQDHAAKLSSALSNAFSPASSNALSASMAAMATPSQKSSSPAPELEEDSDDPDTPIPESVTCRRRACGKSSKDVSSRDEECVYHPGVPIFHEGSKGWTCCKRRVLEFDAFMKIEGCKSRNGHCFIGKRQKKKAEDSEEALEEIRTDFYQTPTTVIVSYYLKKIDKEKAKVTFAADGSGVSLDLPTTDGKRFAKKIEFWRDLVPEKCQYRILGTKLETTLFKKEGGLGWPVLKRGEKDSGERIQVGKALRA